MSAGSTRVPGPVVPENEGTVVRVRGRYVGDV